MSRVRARARHTHAHGASEQNACDLAAAFGHVLYALGTAQFYSEWRK